MQSMATLKVGIADYQEMKARTLRVVRGAQLISSDEAKVWFISTESFAKVLSAGNRELLRIIAKATLKNVTRGNLGKSRAPLIWIFALRISPMHGIEGASPLKTLRYAQS
jgi:predicted transcriptional regulator